MRYTFKVYERLKREQHINTLFLKGKAFSVFPVRLVYLITTPAAGSPAPAMAGFSVPKKKFKSSVHRHRIRRLMVEAWRLHKHIAYAAIPPGRQVHLFLMHTGKEMPGYETIEAAVIKAISKLVQALQQEAAIPETGITELP